MFRRYVDVQRNLYKKERKIVKSKAKQDYEPYVNIIRNG